MWLIYSRHICIVPSQHSFPHYLLNQLQIGRTYDIKSVFFFLKTMFLVPHNKWDVFIFLNFKLLDLNFFSVRKIICHPKVETFILNCSHFKLICARKKNQFIFFFALNEIRLNSTSDIQIDINNEKYRKFHCRHRWLKIYISNVHNIS